MIGCRGQAPWDPTNENSHGKHTTQTDGDSSRQSRTSLEAGPDLATNRDIVENLHLRHRARAVTYAEVNAVACRLLVHPTVLHTDRVLLHSHSGAQSSPDAYRRKAVGTSPRWWGARPRPEFPTCTGSTSFPAQLDDVEKAYRWLLAQGIRPENTASIGHSIRGNLAVSLAVRLRDKASLLPAAILCLTWYDLEMSNETWETNAKTDLLLSRQAWKASRGVDRRTGVAGTIPGSYALSLT